MNIKMKNVQVSYEGLRHSKRINQISVLNISWISKKADKNEKIKELF